MIDTNKIVPDGFILLQTQNGTPKYAACMTGRLAGWLMKKYPDGNWVSERKLTNLEVMQAEDQRDDGIVHETPAATIQEPVMVAEPVGKQAQFDRDIKLAESVRRHIANHCHNKLGVDAARAVNMVELAPIVDRAAPMVADPAGVTLCKSCEGSGEVTGMVGSGPDGWEETRSCPDCGGTGALAATVKAVPSEALSEKEIDFVQRVLASPGNKLNGEGESTDYSEDAEINALWKRPEQRNVVIVMGSYKWRVNPRLAKEVSDATRHIIANFAAPLADKTGGGE